MPLPKAQPSSWQNKALISEGFSQRLKLSRWYILDPHRHQHIPILVLCFWIFGPHLPGRLRVFELQPNFALVAQRFQKVQDIARIESHDNGVARVWRVDRV